MQSWRWHLGISLLFLFYIITVFSTVPFIHPEWAIFSFWWNEPGHGFWDVFFDFKKTEFHAGRFRFFTYLVEGLIYRLSPSWQVRWGFYDYSNLFLNLFSGIFIFKGMRKLKMDLGTSLLGLALFWGSAACFMSGVWLYRKAKILVTLEWALLFYLSTWDPRRWNQVLIVLVCALGVLSDPIFILLTPLFAFGLHKADLCHTSPLKLSLLGILVGGIVAMIFNGIIGPYFNPKVSLYLWNIPKVPDFFFNVRSILQFPYVLNDYLAPMTFGQRPNLAFLWWFFALSFLLFLKKQTGKTAWLSLSFLLAMPVLAFIFRPFFHPAQFASYYGHPCALWLGLLVIETLRIAENKKWKPLVFSVWLAVLIFNQVGKEKVYQAWKDTNFQDHKEEEKKYWADVDLIEDLRRQFNQELGPISISLTGLKEYEPGKDYVLRKPGSRGMAHHDLGYALIPLVFKDQREKGQFSIQD